jgi:hypothetical protein
VRYPWAVQSVPDGVVVGLGGLGLAIGARVTDRCYVGAAAESESISRVTGAAGDPADYQTLRAGGEARVYFHDGAASWGPAPRHDWIGARYGVETFDRGATMGRFADATLGTDVPLGAVGVTVSISAGFSRQPRAAFGEPARRGPQIFASGAAHPIVVDDTVASPYVAFAIGIVVE